MYLGIDIGTTSVCAVVIGEDGTLLRSLTKSNTFGSSDGAARMQDARGIAALCKEIYVGLCAEFSVVSVGVSGQMHGILYLDADGNAVSPLYSWQDERGNLPAPQAEQTYAQVLSRVSGHRIATGYGCCSLYYDAENDAIPAEAVSFCTIGDYVAMQLCGRKAPLVHDTCAASLGLFDLKKRCWDDAAIARAGLPGDIFPATTSAVRALGKTAQGATVYTAIGDNQASVYGSLRDENAFLLNVGTGSQISMITPEYVAPTMGEVRPYLGSAYLLAGCPLCGGYSYRLLLDFFCSLGTPVDYDTLNALAAEAFADEQAGKLTPPTVTPTFRGTRHTPTQRASITGLSVDNFTASALTLGLLRGMSRELGEFYDAFVAAAQIKDEPVMVGAGNAVRLGGTLRQIMEQDWGRALHIPAHTEEASFGAAMAAAEVHMGRSFKHWIHYT